MSSPAAGVIRRGISALLPAAIVAHLLVASLPTMKHISWLLRRNQPEHSITSWRNSHLRNPALIEEINRRVPPQERVVDRYPDQDLALEIAFYAFPHPLEYRATQSADRTNRPQLVLRNSIWTVIQGTSAERQ